MTEELLTMIGCDHDNRIAADSHRVNFAVQGIERDVRRSNFFVARRYVPLKSTVDSVVAEITQGPN